MAIEGSPEAAYQKAGIPLSEMAKFQKPYKYERHPATLYKARRPDSGGPIMCVDPRNDSFSGSNQMTARNKAEEDQALENGWRKTPEEAVELAKALEQAISDAAAEAAFNAKRMSEKAREEFAIADASTPEHLPEPEKVTRRGRPPKAVSA